MKEELSRQKRNQSLYERLASERAEGLSSSGLNKFAQRLSRLERTKNRVQETIQTAQSGRHMRENVPEEPVVIRREIGDDLLQEALREAENYRKKK